MKKQSLNQTPRKIVESKKESSSFFSIASPTTTTPSVATPTSLSQPVSSSTPLSDTSANNVSIDSNKDRSSSVNQPETV